MSTISGFNALMAQAYNNPTTDIENQQRRQQINAMQAQQAEAQARIPQIQAATQGAQLENQQRQLDLNDQQQFSQLFAKHANDNWNDPATRDSFESDLAKSGVSLKGRMGYSQMQLEQSQRLLNLNSSQLAYHEAVNKRAYEIVDAYDKTPDAQKPQMWGQVYANSLNRLASSDPDIGHFDPTQPLVDAQLQALKGHIGFSSMQVKVAKDQADTREANARAKRAEITNKMLENPEQASQVAGGIHPIVAMAQGLDPNDPMINVYKNMYDKGQTITEDINQPQKHELSEAAMKGIAAYADAVNKANNPKIRAGEVQKAVDIKRAEAPVEIQTAIGKRVGELQAEAKLAPGGFANITDQRERGRAEADYGKFSQEYADKAASVQELGDLLDFVHAGNKAAAGRIPMSQVRQYTSRFNRQELEAVGPGAGNAFDRVNAFIEHNFSKSGADFSPEVLKDLDTVNQSMEKAAYRSYGQKVDVLNQEHGLSGDRAVKPVNRIPVTHGQAQSGRKVGDQVRIKGGKTVTIKAVYPDGSFDAE